MDNYFDTFLKAVENAILTQIPYFKHVEIVSGNIVDSADVSNYVFEDKVLKVSLVGISSTLNINTNQLLTLMDLTILFAVKDVKNVANNQDSSVSLLEKILLVLKNGSFGVKNTYPMDNSSISAQSFYKTGVAGEKEMVWQVAWKQKCILGTEGEIGKFPKTYKLDIDISKDNKSDEEEIGKINFNKDIKSN